MAINTSGLISARETLSKYYGDFRGVDFSNDHTKVHDQRFSYLVNMYKDYQSGQGKAIETIPGFRRRVNLPEEAEVYGIHHFRFENTSKVLIHAGSKLYLWHNFPNSINIPVKEKYIVPEPNTVGDMEGLMTFELALSNKVAKVLEIKRFNGVNVLLDVTSFDTSTHVLTIQSSELLVGEELYITYYEGVLGISDALFDQMNERKSTSFEFNNRLYLIDGKNYLVFDGAKVSSVLDEAYIPTTYINIISDGVNADAGTEYEQRNVLTPYFKHTFIADGTATEFYMNENELEEISEVKVYGVLNTDYETDLQSGKITFSTAPPRPEAVEEGYFPEFYAGIEITAKKTLKSVSGVTQETENIHEMITDCTIAAVFDNRVFLSGNPNYPNHVFHCGRNLTGHTDPTYFGILNYMQDGVENAPITGMLPVADTLMVLKGDTQQDGATYFHTPTLTGENLIPVNYPSSRGLSGIGCLGACVNFLDDPVFISRLGVEAIGQLSVRYERAVEHRSSLVDAKLVCTDLKRASLEEWNGYLMVLADGNIFMADSRQKYAHDTGVTQYEWYYLENIGVYKDQYTEYRYSSQIPTEIEGATIHYCTKCKKGITHCTCETENNIIEIPITLANAVYNHELDVTNDLTGTIVNPPDEYGKETVSVFNEQTVLKIDEIDYIANLSYTVRESFNNMGDFIGYEAYLCESKGNCTGGVFKQATTLKSMNDNLFFGTQNGVICSFNFDTRDEYGEIAPMYYSFDERTIFSGCATKMDSCGVPHLNKNTVKKSTVIKTKSLQASAAKIKVRTNRKPYAQIARINNSAFSFGNIDFSDFSFAHADQTLFAIKEKEKKWVEKQYFVYSDEYMKPFALYYISFRYNVSGRYKQ